MASSVHVCVCDMHWEAGVLRVKSDAALGESGEESTASSSGCNESRSSPRVWLQIMYGRVEKAEALGQCGSHSINDLV